MLNLSSKPENMSDTNKLLYLIYGELTQIHEILNRANLSPISNEKDEFNTIGPARKQKPATGKTDGNQTKDVHICKYCGEKIEGNMGNLLAHIKKCPKRKESEEVGK